MNGKAIRVPARSLKEQFSRGSEAWKEQSDPIFRFWAEGDWWGCPFFSLSARFLRCILRPPGNVSQGRWKRHQSPESDTQWRFGRGVELHLEAPRRRTPPTRRPSQHVRTGPALWWAS